MNERILVFAAAAIIAFTGCFVVYELTDGSDAVTEYPVTIFYHPNATIVFDGTTVTYPNSSEPYGYGDPITITATLATGYTFDHWHGNNITEGEPWDAYSNSTGISISGNVVTYNIWCYGETEFTLYLSGGPVTNYTITFYSDSNNWGTIDFSGAPMAVGNQISVPYGTSFFISDDAIFVYTSPYTNFVYAEPNPDFDGWHYTFDSWSWNEGTHTVTSNISITAYFDREVARYTVSFAAGTGGFVSQASIPNVVYNSYPTVNGNQITLNNTTVTATADPGYEFSSWSNATGPITGARTITANFTQIQTYSVTINHNSAYGYVSQTTTFNNVPVGTSVTANGNVLTVGTIGTATATAKSPSSTQTFSFDGWTIPSATVQGNMTVTANFSATYKNFPVTVNYHPNAAIYVDYELTPITSGGWSESTPYGDPVHIRAVLDQGYTFDHWYGNNVTEGEDWSAGPGSSGISINGNEVVYDTWCYGETVFTLYLTGGPGTNYTITFAASPPEYGSLTNTTVTAQYGSQWYISADKFYVDGQIAARAVPRASDLFYDYSFDGWSYLDPSGTVTSNMTVTAYFTRSEVVVSEGTHWTNEMYNGQIDMLFKFGQSDNKTHTMTMDLYSGVVGSDLKTVWNKTVYSLEISQSFSSSASVTVTLKQNGNAVQGMSSTLNLGKWQTYQLTIDTANSVVYAIPVNQFNSFMDYTLYESQKKVILDYSSKTKNTTIYTIDHTDSDSGTNRVRFGVVATKVFLETYGTVLNNPTINVYQYFPQYDSYRLNFYSFAIYGDSISLNGTTYAVNNGQITVSYVDDRDGKHYVPTGDPGETVKTKTMTLSNIYVTWDALEGHCYLTFVDNRFTIDMGTYTHGNEVVSFGGMWYFTTFLYEPHITNVKELGDWETLPTLDKTQICLIFAGLCIVIGAALYVKHVSSIMDTAIIVLALVADLIIMGG